MLLTILSLLCQGTEVIASGQPIHVNTRYGEIAGERFIHDHERKSEWAKTDTVDWFLGIPYAQPPIGQRRLELPVPAVPWRGVLNGTKLPPACPQSLSDYSNVDEDCLYLNIYTPYQKNKMALYPVLLFIHGGGYYHGSGAEQFPAIALARTGIVVVNINYRLGFLGFFTDTERVAGNFGLWDQKQALLWVKDNIHVFRGDPSQVVIAGSSAGAASVGCLLLSPHTQGLFHGAIVMSGPVNSFWAVHNDTVNLRQYSRQVSRILGCSSTGDTDLACLRRIHWKQIIAVQEKFPRITPSATNMRPWQDGVFLSGPPQRQLSQGFVARVPVMIGTTSNEWGANMGWFLLDLPPDNFGRDFSVGETMEYVQFERSVEHVVREKFGWHPAIADVIRHKYTNFQQVHNTSNIRQQYMNIMGDVSFVAPTQAMADALTSLPAPTPAVYMYYYDYLSTQYPEQWRGPFHGCELRYLLGAPYMVNYIRFGEVFAALNYTTTDRQVSARVMTYWSNFVKHKHPNKHTRTNIQGLQFKWEEFNRHTRSYLRITGNDDHQEYNLKPDAYHFWQEVIPKLQETLVSKDPGLGSKTCGLDMTHSSLIIMSAALHIAFVLLLFAITAVNNRNCYRGKRSAAKNDSHIKKKILYL